MKKIGHCNCCGVAVADRNTRYTRMGRWYYVRGRLEDVICEQCWKNLELYLARDKLNSAPCLTNGKEV